MKFAPKLIRILPLLFLMIGCGPSGVRQSSEFDELTKYQAYIAEVTQGIVSVKEEVRVVLTEPISEWESGQDLGSGVLRVSPHVKGKVVALNNRTLAFVPSDGFEQDTEYKFTLVLDPLVPNIPKALKTMVFGIKTRKQQFNVYTDPIQSYSNTLQYINGQLRTSDVMSLDTARELIRAEYNGTDLSIKFDEVTEEGTQFYFKIDSIQRSDEDSQLQISWNGSKYAIESAGTSALKIPGKNNFTLLETTTHQGDDQYVLINFSDPLKKGQNLKGLVVLEGSNDPKYSIEGNTLKVYPSKDSKGTMLLEVFQGVESVQGNTLKTKYEERISFEQAKPEIRLLSNGTLLPSSSNLKINFETVNLRSVDVRVLKVYGDNMLQFLQGNNLDGNYNLRSVARPIARKKINLQDQMLKRVGKWTAHAIDLRKLIDPDPGTMYRVEFDIKPSYGVFNCERTNFETEVAEEDNFDTAMEDSSWDGVESYYYEPYYNYDWNERENPCNSSYYYNKQIGVNVLASDIGLTIKRGANNSYFVAVNDILNTNPIAGAKVTFYNYQQQPIGNVVTNAEGTSIFDADGLAYFAIAENNGQKTFVKLNDGNVLSVSKFDVAGVQLTKGIKGYIFGERGVWRPGDPIHLSFILNDNANNLPEDHPVKLELMDPYNKVVHREIKRRALNNFYYFKIGTQGDSPTGNWLAKVSVGGASFTKTIKVETIKPNRLKINTSFEDQLLGGTKPISGKMEVKWLHGAIAKNLKADINAKFRARQTRFDAFPGYVFDDPTRSFSAEEQVVYDGTLDANGQSNFTLKAQLSKQAPGMLDVAFVTKVYENGGDFSTDVIVKPYSPYSTYIGLNAPKGDKTRGMLLTDTNHRFEVVSVNENGVPMAVNKLKVTVHKIHWRWWWETGEDNLSNFSSSNYREKVFDKTLSTDASGHATFDFELKYPDWGRYLVRVEDIKGGHSTAKTIYIDWPGWAGKSRKNDPSAATMLVFSSDKDTYQVGEKALVTFPSSEDGRALVTLENGSEVLESFWVETSKGETKFDFTIKELYTPNVYIHISLLQPHGSVDNDSPIRLYGVVPISVENPDTQLSPIIEMPKVLRPEEEITLKVNESNGKAMTYSIAIVDEGLLDLTRFKTPDPWKSFYAREALGVKTWDVYDDIIGAYGGKINQVFAIGGDGELAGAKNKKANRFKPMVLYLGPFELKEGQTKSHQINIPKYVGAVRTMVVAANNVNGSYGMAERSTPVRKPLMVLASLPRKLTPGELVTLPVTLFAMEEKIKKVRLELLDDPAFRIEGENVQHISFEQPEEKMAYFKVRVADLTGIGTLAVKASGHGEQASFEIPIDVVNPNPVTTTLEQYVLEPEAEEQIRLERFGIKGSNAVQLEFSTLPPMNFNGRLKSLIRYPHGCVEQTTSTAFPQLFMNDVFEMENAHKSIMQQNIEAAIQRLGNYQMPNGGFSYWPGQSQANDWGTTYAGHFLIEAEKKGYVLPIGFKTSWLQYQQQAAKQWRPGSGNSDLAQAYRLFTLAISSQADIAAMNRLRTYKNLSNNAKIRLAATYAIIGQERVAEELLSGSSLDFNDVKQRHLTYGSGSRNRAMALETFVMVKNKEKARTMAETIAKRLSDKQWMSTQSMAYCLLSMAKFAQLVGGKGVKARLEINGKSHTLESDKTLVAFEDQINGENTLISIKNQVQHSLFVSIANSGILPVGEEKEIQRNLTATVNYKGRDGSSFNISRMTQGTDFIAEVTVTNTTANAIKDVALSTLFPSGWEIVNTRFTDFGDIDQNKAAYTDIRDDRTHFYFDMKGKESKTFRVLLNASYLGSYYLPGVQVEAMYDHDYLVRTKGNWVEVVQ